VHRQGIDKEKVSGSFLKKRTKKLLLLGGVGGVMGAKIFAEAARLGFF